MNEIFHPDFIENKIQTQKSFHCNRNFSLWIKTLQTSPFVKSISKLYRIQFSISLTLLESELYNILFKLQREIYTY